ncbi:hypothetical protein [Nonomuraea dietziae]|uniref:hypothetical protein n=1 Tax=Nonomuraea dietziae TaxID=65515 RepID=UPI0031DC8A2F
MTRPTTATCSGPAGAGAAATRRRRSSFTFRTHPARDVTVFFLHWPWSQGGSSVVRAWQAWAPSAPDGPVGQPPPHAQRGRPRRAGRRRPLPGLAGRPAPSCSTRW